MKKLLYSILALIAIGLTAYLPYKFFIPVLFFSIGIIVSQINLYFYDTRKKEATKL